MSEEPLCTKWNKTPEEVSCNICKDQCRWSVANPDNFIASKLIKSVFLVKENRRLIGIGTEAGANAAMLKDAERIKEEIETKFKGEAGSLLSSLGLGHMKNR